MATEHFHTALSGTEGARAHHPGDESPVPAGESRLIFDTAARAATERRFAIGYKAARDAQSIACHLKAVLSLSAEDVDEVSRGVLLRRLIDLQNVACDILARGLEQTHSNTDELALLVDPDGEDEEVSRG